MTCDVRRVTRDVRRDVGVGGGVRCDLVACDTVTCDVVRRAACDVCNNIKPFTLYIYIATVTQLQDMNVEEGP